MDDDLVLVDNGPSMSVILSISEPLQQFLTCQETSRKTIKKALVTVPEEIAPEQKLRGACHWHDTAFDGNSGSTQSLATLQNKTDKPENPTEVDHLPSKAKLHDGAVYEFGTKEKLDSTGSFPTLKLPYRSRNNPRDFEGCAPPPLPPPPPPPPPPSSGLPQYLNVQGIVPPLPPPPPPPASITTLGLLEVPVNPQDEVSSPAAFLPAQYLGESVLEVVSRVVRLVPFRRNVFTTRHIAHAADFEEHKWILKYGSPDFWYEKPARSYLRNIRRPEELLHLLNARPVSLETPKVWASSALSTPTDNDIYDCSAGHALDSGYAPICQQCTDEKSEALENTPLVYYLVLSTCQASDPFIHGAHFNGCQIYKLIKCGSREAAAAEAFYATGVNGWNIAFSCVMRLGEDFEERSGKVRRVDELWMLAEKEEDENVVRIFY